MKAQSLIKQWLSSPAQRLVHVFLIAVLGLGVFWWALRGQSVKAASSLLLSKENGVDTIVAGQTLVYRVVITNTDVDKATGIRLTDILPDHTTFDLASDGGQEIVPGSGIVTWPDFDLAANSSATRLVVVTVNNPLNGGITAITNTISLRDSYGYTVVATDTDSVEANPVLTLIKTSAVTTTFPGDTLSYAITLTNNTGMQADGVRVTDTLPTGVTFVAADYGGTETFSGSGIVTWTVFDLPASASVTGLLTVTVNSPLPAGVELLVNTIQLTDDAGDTAITKHADIVDAAPDLVLTKSDGGIIVQPGEILTYTLTYTNSGTQDATGVIIAETVPAYTTFEAASSNPAWNCAGTSCTHTAGNLSVNASGAITFAVRFDNPLPAGVTEINNSASIADDGTNGADPTPDNNAATTTTSVDAAPALAISKSNNLDTVIPGQTLIYQIVITNTGDQAAAGIRITDTLPAYTTFYLASDAGQETPPGSGIITWPAFELPGGGASVTHLLVVTVNSPLPAGVTAITNTITLRDDDDNTATAEDTDTVDANPVLTLDKTSTVTTTLPGATFSYTLTLTNYGDQEATGIRITDTLPTGVTFVGASDGGILATGGVVTWPTFSLAGGGASVTRLLTVAVDPALPAGLELLVNTAHAIEDRGYSATAQHAIVVDAAPDLALSKSDGGITVQPGDVLIYTLAYTNTGNQDATGVVIAETVPAYTTFEAASSNPAWNCTGTSCTYAAGTLSVNASDAITFAVRIDNPLPVSVTAIDNSASITDDGTNGADLNPGDNTDTTTTDINAAPDLVVSKDDNRTAVQPGETLAYFVTITNTGNIAAMVSVTDTLPANTSFLIASDGGTETAPGSRIITWPAFNLAGGGARVTRLVVATVGDALPAGVDTITNTVTVTTSNEADGTDNTAWDVDQVNATPDLTLSKSDGGVTVEPGDTLIYTLTYANIGTQGATGVIITETVPAYTIFAGPIGWNCVGTSCEYDLGALPAGASGNVTFAATIIDPLPAGVTQIDNTVTITDDSNNGADPTPANNTATTTTPVDAAPDLAISKSDGVDTVNPGDTLTYQIVVTNTGNQDAASVVVSDALPEYTTFVSASDGGSLSAPGVVTWPPLELDGGGTSATRSLTVIVTNPFPADTNLITNTATVADEGIPYATAFDEDSVTAAPILALSKDDGVTSVTPGSTLIYRLVITNTGNQLAAGIVLTDTLPEYTNFSLASDNGQETAPGSGIVTWPAFDLPGGGASTTRLLVVTVDDSLPAGVNAITNSATLRDNKGLTANATDEDLVVANPDFILSKTNAVTTTTPGATLSYAITITNTGNQDATGVIITDTLPAEVTFDAASDGGDETFPGSSVVIWPDFSLASGASATRYLTVTVNSALSAGLELLINTADAADNRGYTATNQHVDFVDAAPDLTISKTDGGLPAHPGETFVYTLTYANTGNQDAAGVVIAEVVPAYTTFDAAGNPGWTCADEAPAGTTCMYSVGDLLVSATDIVTFAVDVVMPLPTGVTETENTATIADDGTSGEDADPADNTVTITTPIVAAPDLIVSKDDGRAAVQPGETLSYLITITNTGDLDAASIWLTDTLPLHTTFVAASDGGTETAPGIVTWPTFSLAGNGEYVTRLVIVTVDDPMPAGVDSITNTVTATTLNDSNIGDNTAEDVDTIVAAPDLALTKDANAVTVEPGDALAYTLIYANLGNQEATGVVITETVPANATFDPAASHPGWSCAGATCTYMVGSLPAGTTSSISFTVNVAPSLPAGVTQIANTAGITDDGANGADTDPANNTDGTVTSVIAAPDLTLVKSDGGVTTQPGATLVYTLTYANVGNQDATGVVVAETVPANTTFAGPIGWSCVDTSCEYDLGALPAGASGDITFAVAVVNPLPAGVTQIDNTASITDDGNNGADPTPANNTAVATTPVDAVPDLEIRKSNGVDDVDPGDILTYQIVVANTGNQNATGVRITDNLPAYTTYVAASDSGSQTAPGVVTWPTFDLAGGTSVTRSVTVEVPDPFPSDTNAITNTITVADDGVNGVDPTPGNNTATDTDSISAAALLLMIKDDDITTVTPGSTLVYRLVISNTGNQLATGIRLTDTLPANTTFYIASDEGQETAPGSGVVVWPAFNLPGGTSTTRLLVATLDNPLPAGVTSITNTAVLADNHGNIAEAEDVDIVDANPLLALDKTNAVETTVPGATITYTLTLTNNGNQEATGVLITDTLPADVTFVAASDGGYTTSPGVVVWPAFNLAGGSASVTRYLTIAVDDAVPAGVEILVNTARAIEDRGYAATAQHADIVVAAPDLAITKTDNGIAPQPGEVLQYTLTYTNVGNQGATGVVIAESVPAYTTFDAAASSLGWTCAGGEPAGTSCTYTVGDLPANDSGAVTFAVRVVTPLPVGVTQTENTASIADDGSNGADTDPANNSVSIVTPFDATIDLLITKDDGGITVEPSETIVYTLTYANSGDQIAGGVVITETVPTLTTFNQTASSSGWTCAHGAPAGTVCTYSLGDVIEGGTLLFAVDVVLPFPLDVTEIANQAIIGADANNIPDADPENNTATVITPIITRPDLVIGKDDGFSVVLPEQQFTYVITVTNVGTQNATGVLITDTMPAFVSFIGASDGGIQSQPGIVTWPAIPQIVLGEVVTRTLSVMVDSTLPAGVSQITNTVTVGDDGRHGLDLNPADNTAIDVNFVGAMPDLILDKAVDRAVIYPTGPLVYTIHVENTGSQGATGVSIVDTLSPDTHFVSASDGGYESAPGIVNWPAFALTVGEQATRTLSVQVASSLPEGHVLTNTATVTDDGANGEDPTPENNTDTASSIIKWPRIYLPIVLRNFSVGPDLIVEKVVFGDNSIAITIRNQGKFPVPAPSGFWVDLYINPWPVPTQVNQLWDQISAYGAAWGVDRYALPIPPDGTYTIYLNDEFYKPTYSRLPDSLRAGDVIYVQVDSYNAATNYGVVWEDHEMSGLEYNNIYHDTITTTYPLPATMIQSVPESLDSHSLPERP